jgi:hypothetical protein
VGAHIAATQLPLAVKRRCLRPTPRLQSSIVQGSLLPCPLLPNTRNLMTLLNCRRERWARSRRRRRQRTRQSPLCAGARLGVRPYGTFRCKHNTVSAARKPATSAPSARRGISRKAQGRRRDWAGLVCRMPKEFQGLAQGAPIVQARRHKVLPSPAPCSSLRTPAMHLLSCLSA